MSAAEKQTRDVVVGLPMGLPGLDEQPNEALSKELRLLWIVEQVRHHRLSTGRGASLAELPIARFLEVLGEHGVPVFDYSADELSQELEAYDRVSRGQ